LSKFSSSRRSFKRYKRETEFRLDINSETFNCKLLNYSCDGISAIIYGSPSLRTGTRLKIKIQNPHIECEGQVTEIKPLSSTVEIKHYRK
jgi:hypothetical protein